RWTVRARGPEAAAGSRAIRVRSNTTALYMEYPGHWRRSPRHGRVRSRRARVRIRGRRCCPAARHHYPNRARCVEPDSAQRAEADAFWHVWRKGRKFPRMTNTRAIGRVIGTERQPNTPHEFRFWTAPDSEVGIGALVRVQVETPRPVTVY